MLDLDLREDVPPGYSRDEVITAITSFYKFLVKMYIHSEAIIYPPPGGWPELTSQRLSCLGKTDAAVDLIRHLPFIGPIYHEHTDLGIYELWPETAAIHYSSERFFDGFDGEGPTIDKTIPLDWQTVIPPHVVTFATTTCGRYGEWAFLDTERGTITVCDFMENGPTTPEKDFPGEEWRGFPTYAPKTFFEFLKKKYTSLKLLPVDDHTIRKMRTSTAGGGDLYEADDPIRNIFRQHGWPTENYRKEECMQKLKEFNEQDRAGRREKYCALQASGWDLMTFWDWSEE